MVPRGERRGLEVRLAPRHREDLARARVDADGAAFEEDLVHEAWALFHGGLDPQLGAARLGRLGRVCVGRVLGEALLGGLEGGLGRDGPTEVHRHDVPRHRDELAGLGRRDVDALVVRRDAIGQAGDANVDLPGGVFALGDHAKGLGAQAEIPRVLRDEREDRGPAVRLRGDLSTQALRHGEHAPAEGVRVHGDAQVRFELRGEPRGRFARRERRGVVRARARADQQPETDDTYRERELLHHDLPFVVEVGAGHEGVAKNRRGGSRFLESPAPSALLARGTKPLRGGFALPGAP